MSYILGYFLPSCEIPLLDVTLLGRLLNTLLHALSISNAEVDAEKFVMSY